MATYIKKIKFTLWKLNRKKIVKSRKEWFKTKKKQSLLDGLRPWILNFQKFPWTPLIQVTNLLKNKRPNLNPKKSKREKNPKNLEISINRKKPITLQQMEMTKKRETNSVGTETKIMESTKMT